MDLLESVQKFVLRSLPHDDTDPNVVSALSMKHPGELLTLYLNWRDRLVPATPRRVMTSPEFNRNPITQERSEEFSQIVADIEHGHDLTKYLSRRVKIGFELSRTPQKKLKRLQHLDLLLNDWGVHHLHISTELDPDGFVNRDGDPFLLFAVFRKDRAYLIDVMKHEFSDDRLMQIVIDTWPTEGLVTEVKGVTAGPRVPTKMERTELRSAGLATFFQIGGRVFFPGTSISTAGTSIKASIYANRILRTLKSFAAQITNDPSKLAETFRRYGVSLPDNPIFEFTFFQEGFGVVETKSGVPIGLGI